MSKKEYQDHIIMIYDNWLYQKEQREISYGEIAYINNLNKKELEELERAIEEDLQQ